MKKWILIAAATLITAHTAHAQLGEVSFGGGVSSFGGNGSIGSYTDVDAANNPVNVDLSLTSGFRMNFRFTINSYRFFGHEFGYGYNRTKLNFGTAGGEQGMSIHQGFYNFLAYATPEGTRVRPFVTGGAHFSNHVPPGVSALSGGGDNKFGINYGGGVKVLVTNAWLFRVDFREYSTGKPFDLPNQSGRMRHREISAGVGFMF
jgi:opacity protein-like surface antigen